LLITDAERAVAQENSSLELRLVVGTRLVREPRSLTSRKPLIRFRSPVCKERTNEAYIKEKCAPSHNECYCIVILSVLLHSM